MGALLYDGYVDACLTTFIAWNSARQLLYACLGYLRDWCSLEQRTVRNLKALLDAACPSAPGSAATDLGDLFYEIRWREDRLSCREGREEAPRRKEPPLIG